MHPLPRDFFVVDFSGIVRRIRCYRVVQGGVLASQRLRLLSVVATGAAFCFLLFMYRWITLRACGVARVGRGLIVLTAVGSHVQREPAWVKRCVTFGYRVRQIGGGTRGKFCAGGASVGSGGDRFGPQAFFVGCTASKQAHATLPKPYY